MLGRAGGDSGPALCARRAGYGASREPPAELAPCWGTAMDRMDSPAQHAPLLISPHICLKTFNSYSPDVDFSPFLSQSVTFLKLLIRCGFMGMGGKVKNANWEDLPNQLV